MLPATCIKIKQRGTCRILFILFLTGCHPSSSSMMFFHVLLFLCGSLYSQARHVVIPYMPMLVSPKKWKRYVHVNDVLPSVL